MSFTFKMRCFTVALILAFSVIPAFGQDIQSSLRPRHIIGASLFGDPSILSVHYEKLSFDKEKLFITTKLGLGFWEQIVFFGSNKYYLTGPHHVTLNFGKHQSYFEVGLGGTIVTRSIANQYVVNSIVGYRFQPVKPELFNFRIFVSIPFTWSELYVPAGLSTGFCF